jgi:hypothetical protein
MWPSSALTYGASASTPTLKIIGKKIVLDGVPHEVVGVTRPDLHFFRGQQLHPRIDLSEKTDVFLPLRFSVAQEQGARSI